VVLGIPVLTADYDFWIAIDDIEMFNAAVATLDLHPSKPPAEARRTGRYVLENDTRVDVLIARSVTATTGEVATFEDIWTRRQQLDLGNGVSAVIPSVDDLIVTKRFALRRKDADDVRLLQAFKEGRGL
jgi:hypothetical protein